MPETKPISWADATRASRFAQWLQAIALRQNIDPEQVAVASADASFRRYLRVQGTRGQPARIIMDAPPDKEDCRAFVHVAGLMQAAGLHAPAGAGVGRGQRLHAADGSGQPNHDECAG